MKKKWIVQINGAECSEVFEISVIREDYLLGLASWGWINEKKLLISQSDVGRGALTKIVWDKMVKLAGEVALELNTEKVESVRR